MPIHIAYCITDNKGNVFHIKQFIIWSMEFVIDVLRCPCNLLYIRRTMQKCIGEHWRFIKKGCDEHSVPCNFLQAQKKDICCLEVMAIEAIPKGTLMKHSPSFAREKPFGSLNLDLCPLMASTRILKCILLCQHSLCLSWQYLVPKRCQLNIPLPVSHAH